MGEVTLSNTLIIDRRLWARGGRNSRHSKLLVGGKLCCLGFHALACGLRKDEIEDMGTPRSAIVQHKLDIPEGMRFLFGDSIDHPPHSAAARTLMEINDDEQITDDEREKQLTTVFTQYGWAVTFIGPELPEGEEGYR